MNTVHVLIANSDRRLNNLIEVAVRDVCYEHYLVECGITNRLDELLHRGSVSEFGLIFITPDHIVSGPTKRAPRVTIEKAAEAIRTIKGLRPVPIIAVGVRSPDEIPLLEAGADNVFGILFDRDEFRAEIRRVLNLNERVQEEEPAPSRWSFGLGFLRNVMSKT